MVLAQGGGDRDDTAHPGGAHKGGCEGHPPTGCSKVNFGTHHSWNMSFDQNCMCIELHELHLGGKFPRGGEFANSDYLTKYLKSINVGA